VKALSSLFNKLFENSEMYRRIQDSELRTSLLVICFAENSTAAFLKWFHQPSNSVASMLGAIYQRGGVMYILRPMEKDHTLRDQTKPVCGKSFEVFKGALDHVALP